MIFAVRERILLLRIVPPSRCDVVADPCGSPEFEAEEFWALSVDPPGHGTDLVHSHAERKNCSLS